MKIINRDGSTSRYLNGWQRYREVLERLVLPPRMPRGDARNQRRTLHVNAALHQERVRGTKHLKRGCKLCRVRVRLMGVDNAST